MKFLQKVLAHGMAGCLMGLLGALFFGTLGFWTADWWNFLQSDNPNAEWEYIPWTFIFICFFKVAHFLVFTLLGLLFGFFTGFIINIIANSIYHKNSKNTLK